MKEKIFLVLIDVTKQVENNVVSEQKQRKVWKVYTGNKPFISL